MEAFFYLDAGTGVNSWSLFLGPWIIHRLRTKFTETLYKTITKEEVLPTSLLTAILPFTFNIATFILFFQFLNYIIASSLLLFLIFNPNDTQR